ncbi:MAG: TolC family protein, partial [Bacteroidales bacterium]|nr:TolC family protein [Bacteroidales bacterium]
MKKNLAVLSVIAAGLLYPLAAGAQYRNVEEEDVPMTETQLILQEAESSETPVVITLEQALEIALSENVSVKVADMEIERTGYAKKGSYAALFPQIDISGAYQRTIKKQVMYMDFDMSSLGGAAGGAGAGAGSGTGDEAGSGTTLPDGTEIPGNVEIPETDTETSTSNSGGGLEVGRWNTWSAGVSAAMPLVNAQLWKSIKISGMDVELAVEKARSSRLETVTQVKNAYYAILLSKEAFNVYKDVYENAMDNLAETQKKYDAQKASEFDLIRARTTVEQAIPNVYNAESSIILALWQLKAVL